MELETVSSFLTKMLKALKCCLNICLICSTLTNFFKPCLISRVDRLHPAWRLGQMLWAEAGGGWGQAGWWQAEKGWKGSWRLARGVSTQASRDSTPFLSGGRGRMASGPPTHV